MPEHEHLLGDVRRTASGRVRITVRRCTKDGAEPLAVTMELAPKLAAELADDIRRVLR